MKPKMLMKNQITVNKLKKMNKNLGHTKVDTEKRIGIVKIIFLVAKNEPKKSAAVIFYFQIFLIRISTILFKSVERNHQDYYYYSRFHIKLWKNAHCGLFVLSVCLYISHRMTADIKK